MANELTITHQISLNNGTLRIPQLGQTIQVDQTTAAAGPPAFVDLSTSEEDIDFGDVTPRFAYIKNLDAAIAVQYGPKNASNVMQLLGQLDAGQDTIVPLASGVTLRMVAASGTPSVQIVGFSA